MLDRGQTLLSVQWPRRTLAGLATLAFWIAGILFAAGGLRFITRRLSLGESPGTALTQRAAAD